MNREKRVIYDLDDILAIRIRCNNNQCGQEHLIKLGNGRGSVPVNCPSCLQAWRIAGQNPEPYVVRLFETLILMRNGKTKEGDLLVRFEFEDGD